MLTPRQNFFETIRGGHPDRFVEQYEYIKIIGGDPFSMHNTNPKKGELNVVNSWGITRSYPDNVPGPFPVHTPGKIVCPDVTEWKETVKAPNVIFDEDEWAPFVEKVNAVDRTQYLVAPLIAPGLFEMTHFLMEMQNALMSFYEEPDDMKDLIKYLKDFYMRYVEQLIKYMHPDAIFQHDDWGSQISTFLSPDMFAEFFLDAYKELYGFYKANGVEVIVHHSDSYAETLVPYMIEMGIDVWQGTMTTNDINGIIEKYGGKISIMGGIDSASVDHPGWTREEIADVVEKACIKYGSRKKYFIPCASQGLAISTYPGVYGAISEEIGKMSKKMF